MSENGFVSYGAITSHVQVGEPGKCVAVARVDSLKPRVFHRIAQAGMVEGYQCRDGGQANPARVKGKAFTFGKSRHCEVFKFPGWT
jgi:hypothetical protein